MLGSGVPKRWIVSLALVGLVSLFMASYSAVWTGPASASPALASTPEGPPSPTVTPEEELEEIFFAFVMSLRGPEATRISYDTYSFGSETPAILPGVDLIYDDSSACGTVTDVSDDFIPPILLFDMPGISSSLAES